MRLWFCARAHVKREAVAAARLQTLDGVEVFCPRVRLRRMTTRGPVWFVEALFPGYFFCRFQPDMLLRRVLHSPGVTGIVRFGDQPAEVPDTVVAALRASFVDDEPLCIEHPLQPGDEALVASGSLAGLKVLVTRVMPTERRIVILFDLLGRTVESEVAAEQLMPAPGRGPPRID